jgi:hypothetical protein
MSDEELVRFGKAARSLCDEIARLFDLETAPKKRLISDEETLAQMEREEEGRRLEEACGLFLSAERRFQKLNAHPDKLTDPKVNVAWWDAL